ncbi:aromatic prenyltransferase [Ceraceosorus guamensis]|uniref:Aromatic prenyltransferase n=1 Tax=Ceraceosorus guamensis TaxID=1522189 RepID=A0A316VQB5_9BASI|nr:aromatic prenyltransferase [Ceraceosorus guamensis]PWN39258.1 aromatic prenyltransferase [Ceraceosorus guamensis]
MSKLVVGSSPHSSAWRAALETQFYTLKHFSTEPEAALDQLQSFFEKHFVDDGLLGAPGELQGQPSRWTSFVADDHSLLEYSLAISHSYTRLRLVFEPAPIQVVSQTSRDRQTDPINILAPLQWIQRHGALGPRTDLTWFQALLPALTVMPSDKIPKEASGFTQLAFGVELHSSEIMMKAYFGLDAKAIADGRCKEDIVEEALAGIQLRQSWLPIRSYLFDLQRAGKPAALEFCGVDCVSSDQARMKLYIRFSRIDLQELEKHLDCKGHTDRKVFESQKTWARELFTLFDEKREQVIECADSDLSAQEARSRGALVYYELRKGTTAPTAKFYLPIRHYAADDDDVVQKLDGFLFSRGLREAGWYRRLVQAFVTHRALAKRSGVQSIIGCAYKKGIPELTVYLATELYAPERPWMI